MQKIVINRCYGGFGLSHDATVMYAHLKDLVLITSKANGFTHYYIDEAYDNNYFIDRDIARDDPCLVEVVETLGDKASGGYADLAVVEIPDGVEWQIEEYDGNEWVAEAHRTWS